MHVFETNYQLIDGNLKTSEAEAPTWKILIKFKRLTSSERAWSTTRKNLKNSDSGFNPHIFCFSLSLFPQKEAEIADRRSPPPRPINNPAAAWFITIPIPNPINNPAGMKNVFLVLKVKSPLLKWIINWIFH